MSSHGAPSNTSAEGFPKVRVTRTTPHPGIHDAFRYKSPSHYLEPCELASKAAYACLDRNNYNKKKCGKQFLQYRECKKKWGVAVSSLKGINFKAR
ncbi:hypothetical protein G9A89_006495 [Geosiphon pyriformis]|nr:hypothetical protein G9A89_006495 [Geosiphon pyriformis]